MRPPIPPPIPARFRPARGVPTHGNHAALSACPFGGCKRTPLPIFCPECWEAISAPTREVIVRTWKTMTKHRVKKLPKGFVELLGIAVKEIGRA